MLDSLLLLRDGSTALTATEATPTGKKCGPFQGMVAVAKFPAAGGTTPTCALKLQTAPDSAGSAGTYGDRATFYDGANIVAKGVYFLRFSTKNEWVRYVATVGGTTPNFGNVVIGLDVAGQYDKQ